MRRFESQIRLQRWHVDEAQKKLAQLIRLEDGLRRDRAKLDEELSAEQLVAAQSVETGMTYGSYAMHVMVRREKLEQSIADVIAQVEQARELLKDAFGELKKYELAAASADQRARLRAGRRDRVQEDEMALGVFRRQSSEVG